MVLEEAINARQLVILGHGIIWDAVLIKDISLGQMEGLSQ